MQTSKPLSSAERQIAEEALAIFPPWSEVLDDAQRRLRSVLTKSFIDADFSRAVKALNEEAYDIFQAYEKKAWAYIISRWLETVGGDVRKMHEEAVMKAVRGDGKLGDILADVVGKVVSQSYPAVSAFETSVANMKKKRAGETFQESILRLLTQIEIPCEKAVGAKEADLRHTDICVPDIETAQSEADKAFFIGCQHTLAERWWGVTPMTKNGTAYLITMDQRLRAPKAVRMNAEKLTVYVLDEEKRKEHLAGLPWVRSMSVLPRDLRSRTSRR